MGLHGCEHFSLSAVANFKLEHDGKRDVPYFCVCTPYAVKTLYEQSKGQFVYTYTEATTGSLKVLLIFWNQIHHFISCWPNVIDVFFFFFFIKGSIQLPKVRKLWPEQNSWLQPWKDHQQEEGGPNSPIEMTVSCFGSSLIKDIDDGMSPEMGKREWCKTARTYYVV